MTSVVLKAFKGERTDQVPIWFMRQAGRYLPEYMELRSEHSMLELLASPELAAEVTMQPIRRFGFDAAIIFADILNVLIEMGVELDFVKGEGPKIFTPVVEPADIDRFNFDGTFDCLNNPLEAISLTVEQLKEYGTPLLGFAGAPFTLSSYLLDGKAGKGVDHVKKFMYAHPEDWDRLQRKLIDVIVPYMVAQVERGVSGVQLFDSWLGALSAPDYRVYVEPYIKEIIRRFKEKSDVPFIFFSTGTAGILPEISELDFDVLGVDWRINLGRVGDTVGTARPVQGNLDPVLLFGPQEQLKKHVLSILEAGREFPAHIFNLGHGILPQTPLENVQLVIDLVRGFK